MSATECNEAQQLDARQLRAVDLLAEGKTDSQVAVELGINRSTVWRWRTRDAFFQAELAQRRAELWDASHDRLRSLLPRALDVVAEALDKGEWRAALGLLKLGRISETYLGSFGPTDPAEIIEAELEEQRRAERRRRFREGLAERFSHDPATPLLPKDF